MANSVASHQLTQATATSAKVAATNVSLSNVATTTATATTVVKARPGGGQMAMQDVRTTSANANVQQTAQRIATASLVSAGQTSTGAAGSQKGGLVGVTMATAASGSKTPTPAQVQYYRQQQQQQVLLRQQQLKVLQAQAASGQKVSVAVSATAAAAAQQRAAAAATLMKQGIGSVSTAGAATPQTGKPTLTRTMSDTEMAALLKRQALQNQAKVAAAAVGQVSVLTRRKDQRRYK